MIKEPQPNDKTTRQSSTFDSNVIGQTNIINVKEQIISKPQFHPGMVTNQSIMNDYVNQGTLPYNSQLG